MGRARSSTRLQLPTRPRAAPQDQPIPNARCGEGLRARDRGFAGRRDDLLQQLRDLLRIERLGDLKHTSNITGLVLDNEGGTRGLHREFIVGVDLVEDVRAALTEEIRRSDLIKTIKKLTK